MPHGGEPVLVQQTVQQAEKKAAERFAKWLIFFSLLAPGFNDSEYREAAIWHCRVDHPGESATQAIFRNTLLLLRGAESRFYFCKLRSPLIDSFTFELSPLQFCKNTRFGYRHQERVDGFHWK